MAPLILELLIIITVKKILKIWGGVKTSTSTPQLINLILKDAWQELKTLPRKQKQFRGHRARDGGNCPPSSVIHFSPAL
jgi:hypothetical protein